MVAKNIKIYIILLKAYTKGQMSYRSSYIYEILGMLTLTLVHILGIYFLFQKFIHVGGWSFWEVVYLYGLATVSMGVAQLLSSGLNHLPEFIRTGDFDRYLIRPISPLIHILPYSFAIHRIGRVTQGVLAVGVSLYMRGITFGVFEIWILGTTLFSVTLVYFSLFLIGATCTFWTVQSSELFNAFTYGGMEMSKYPVSIYQPWLRTIFLYIIPIGFVSYLPTVALFNKGDPLQLPLFFQYITPLVAIFFLFIGIRFWKFGIKHYQSTGS
jgi:ABC-2 type transport system permease protein